MAVVDLWTTRGRSEIAGPRLDHNSTTTGASRWRYQSLVRNLALGILRKLSSGNELDDLISHGNFGLARAIDAYDPSRGFKFETYATPIVRGAIYSGLRPMDWLPERGRSRTSDVKEATRKLQRATGRDATEAELADELAISADGLYEMIASLGCIYLLSLELQVAVEDDSEITMMELVEGFPDEQPALEKELGEYRQKLRRAVEQLDDERYKFVLTQHYFRGLTFEAIARELGVSRHRIRQMHTVALRRLRNPKGNGPDFLPPAASGTQPPPGGPPSPGPPEAKQPARLIRPPKMGGPGNALRQPEG